MTKVMSQEHNKKCACPYPRDGGKCYADQHGLAYPFGDAVDLYCECDCHLSKNRSHDPLEVVVLNFIKDKVGK